MHQLSGFGRFKLGSFFYESSHAETVALALKSALDLVGSTNVLVYMMVYNYIFITAENKYLR